MTLTLLIQMNNTTEKMPNKNNYLKTQMRKKAPDNNYKIFTQILITTFYHQQ